MSSHPVDTRVGERIRARRKELQISQQALGRKLGVTYQQVQKYERAENCVSASMLYEIAQFLEVPIEWFFIGLDGREPEPSHQLILDALAGLGPNARKAVASLIKEMAKSSK